MTPSAPPSTTPTATTTSANVLDPSQFTSGIAIPQMIGMIFLHEGNYYRIAEDGSFAPYEPGMQRRSNDFWAIEWPFEPDENGVAQLMVTQISGWRAPVAIPGTAAVEFETFVTHRSDWILLSVAYSDSYWEYELPDSAIFNLRTRELRPRGSHATVDKRTGLIAYITNENSLYHDPEASRVAIYDVENDSSKLIQFSDFGLAMDGDCFSIPAWDPWTSKLFIAAVWYGRQCEPSEGMVILNLEEQSGIVVPIDYSGPEGPIVRPQFYGEVFAWQGGIGDRFGTWLFDTLGNEIAHYPNGIRPKFVAEYVIAYQVEGEGWHLRDLVRQTEIIVPFEPYRVNGRDVWGITYNPAVSPDVYNWWLDTATQEICLVALPAGARFVARDLQDYIPGYQDELQRCSPS